MLHWLCNAAIKATVLGLLDIVLYGFPQGWDCGFVGYCVVVFKRLVGGNDGVSSILVFPFFGYYILKRTKDFKKNRSWLILNFLIFQHIGFLRTFGFNLDIWTWLILIIVINQLLIQRWEHLSPWTSALPPFYLHAVFTVACVHCRGGWVVRLRLALA